MKKPLIAILIVGIGLIAAGTWYMQQQPGPVTTINGVSYTWKEVKNSVYPQLMPMENTKLLPFAFKPFSQQVAVGFVIDKEESYDFILQEHTKQWGITVRSLEKQAIKNLDKKTDLNDVQVFTLGDDSSQSYVTIEIQDGYDSARILLPSLRKYIASVLGEEARAAVPTRDFLIFWTKGFPLHTDFRNQVLTEYKAGDEGYRLTPNILHLTQKAVVNEEKPEQ